MTKRLLGWSLVTATLTMLGHPAVAHAGGPYEASEARGSNDGPSPTGPVAADAVVGVPEAEPERSVTTVTTVEPEVVPRVSAPQPAATAPVSVGTVRHVVPRSTVKVVTTTTIRSSPYQVHHHHHHWTPTPPASAPPPRAEPEPEPRAVFSVPRYAPFPYASGSAGHVDRVPWPTGTPSFGEGSPPGRMFSGQASTDVGTAGKGVLRVGASMRLSYWRFVGDANLSYLLDRRAQEALYLGNANLMIAPVLRPRLVWLVGGGVNYMMDAATDDQGRHRTWYGHNLTSSVDVFPVRPLVLSARMDLGKLGDASVLGARATAGIMMQRFELYGGYQLQRIGEHSLRGPLFGLRVWF